MSRQSELMAISESNGQKRFRFYLQNATKGNLLLRYAPGGWESAKFEIKRNEKYWGLFRAITFNELSFKKDARDFIRDVYENEGINGKIIFTVYRLSGDTYVSYFAGKLDLSTYKIDETGVSCQVVDTSFHEKVKNRENVKVNIRERISIEGYEIPAFSNEDPEFDLPDYTLVANATWSKRANMDTILQNHYVPLWETISEFTETQSQNCDTVIADGNAMFEDSTADRSVRLSGHISGVCYFTSVQPHVTFTIKIYIDGVVDSTIGTVNGAGVSSLSFDFDFNENFAITTGQDFWIQGTLDHAGETVYDNDINVSMAVTISTVSGGVIIGYPYYEAFLRTLQLITDDNDVLKSDYFGRTDSEVVTYASDGQLGHVTKGLYIRQANGLNDTMAISLTELFHSLASLYQIGMGIEQVSGVDKVIIEELQYFFSSTVVIDLSARIREDAIGKEVMPDKHYNQIEVGYNSFETESNGGVAEFNTKSSFTTVISVLDNKLDLVSKYRADTQGIVKLRQGVSEDADVKGDENNFLIDTIRGGGSGFTARTDEGFTSVTGGVDADNSFNLMITPKRNLLRHGDIIRAGLQKNLGTYLRWQAGDKNTTLATMLTTETEILTENSDVLVNDLEEPFFIPEIYTFECEMRYSDLSTILANQKGLIKIADDKYGWIMSLTIGEQENRADIRLLRANLNVVTPA